MFFNNYFVCEGDLAEEGDIIEWLVQNRSSGDEEDTIEEVSTVWI
jgi:hypothetical protein